MSHIEWTPKVIALTVVGSVATVLLIMSVTRFWRHQFHQAIWLFALGLLLVLIFFRHRKIAFSLIALTFVFVNAGLDVPFHPTVPGIITTLVSGGLLYRLAMWANTRYAHFKRSDFKKFFDRDPE